MIRLDAATLLLQWATGGLAFLWVTARRQVVGLGYGWLLRFSYAVLALGGFGAARFANGSTAVGLASLAVALVALAVTGVAVRNRREGIAAVSARLDLLAPAIGVVGLVVAAGANGGPYALALLRLVVGAAFLGVVSDAMLLGHWYLVQPGLERGPLLELVRWLALIWPAEVAVMLLPIGMVSVFTGSVDDGWNGLLGWMWLVCAVTTIGLCAVTRAALRERQYAAVMAATGLLYLAILTALGQDLVARAVLSG